MVGSTVVLEDSQFDNETTNQRTMLDAIIQLLFDVAQEMFHEHCHCSHKVQEQLPLAYCVL